MKKRIFIYLITVIMIIACLSACTPGTSDTKSPSPTIYFGNYDFNLPSESYDFGGKTFTIYAYHGQAFEQREDFMRRYALNEQIEKKYNVKIAYNLDLDGARAAAIAGAPVTDFAMVANSILASYVKGGVIESLNNYLTELNINDANVWETETNKWNNINGNQYGVTMKYKELWKYHDAIALFMNKTLLENCGIDTKTIYEKQENKQWNWDAFSQVAKTVTRDINGDDAPDVYGLSLSNQFMLEGFMASNNTNIIKIKDDGSFIFEADNKVVSVIDYLSGLMRNGAARGPASYTGVTDDMSDYLSGRLGFFSALFASTWISMTEMSDEYGVLCFPMAPTESDYYITNGSLGGWVMFAQPDKARAKEIAKFMYIYSTPLYYDDADEAECFWQEANNRIHDEESRYYLQRIFDGKNVLRFNNSTYMGNGLPFYPDEAYTGSKTTQQLIEELTPTCQQFMQSFYAS